MESLHRWLRTSRQRHRRLEARQKARADLKREIKSILIEHRGDHARDGSRQTYYGSKVKEKLGIGVTKFERLVSELGMTIKPLKHRINLSERSVLSQRFENLTNGLKLSKINQLIVGDLTENTINGKKWYLFLLTDVYSGYLVGLSGGTRMTAEIALEALNQYFELRGNVKYPGTIHHTDGGAQYFSNLYIGRLKEANMQISVAGNCLENGHAEQRNDTIKNRYLRYMDTSSEAAFQKSLIKIRYLINHKRIQMRRNKMTPVAFERWVLSLPEEERPRYELHDFEHGPAKREV